MDGFGIGASVRRKEDKALVTGHVLGKYHKTEIEPLSDMLGAIAAEAGWLAAGEDVRFMNDVAMRLADG